MFVETGKMIVEGRKLYDSESNFIKERRKFSYDGVVMISIIIEKDFSVNKNINISTLGLTDLDQKEITSMFKNYL